MVALLSRQTQVGGLHVPNLSVGKLSRLQPHYSWGKGLTVINSGFVPVVQMAENPEDLSQNANLLRVNSVNRTPDEFGELAPVVDTASRIIISYLAGRYAKRIGDLSKPEKIMEMTAALLKGHPELLQQVPDIVNLLHLNGNELEVDQRILSLVANQLAQKTVQMSA
jgi:hypothetical protein